MSSLQSMTGFARASDSFKNISWHWEVKSVNAKGRDIRVKVPAGLGEMELLARKTLSARFSRGTLHVTLSLNETEGAGSYDINWQLFDTLLSHVGEGADRAVLMTVEGVVRERDVASVMTESLKADIFETLDTLVDKLLKARAEEGEALRVVLAKCLDTIESLNQKAEGLAARQVITLKDNLGARLTELLGDDLEPERLVQEAAYLALKADIREELDRISAHVKQGRELLSLGSPIGRKLDFLSQEFNREINTLCSKSADSELTQIGMELKSVNEQFREQAANVE